MRLRAIACGPGIETLPQFVCLAVYHRGSTAVCVAGADRRINEVFIELLNGDRTQPNTDATYRTYGTASTDYILPRFSSLLAHNTKTKLEFYRHQPLRTTARNAAAIPTGPNYHGYLFYLSEFPPG